VRERAAMQIRVVGDTLEIAKEAATGAVGCSGRSRSPIVRPRKTPVLPPPGFLLPKPASPVEVVRAMTYGRIASSYHAHPVDTQHHYSLIEYE